MIKFELTNGKTRIIFVGIFMSILITLMYIGYSLNTFMTLERLEQEKSIILNEKKQQVALLNQQLEELNTEKISTENQLKLMDLSINENLYILAKIISLEEGSQKEEDLFKKVAVGIVILNRVKSPKFPNTIEEVVFQRNQFTPTFDGNWDKREPTQFDYLAAKLAIKDVIVKGNSNQSINNALYFMDPKYSETKNVNWFRNNLVYLDKVGDHEFYTEPNYVTLH